MKNILNIKYSFLLVAGFFWGLGFMSFLFSVPHTHFEFSVFLFLNAILISILEILKSKKI